MFDRAFIVTGPRRVDHHHHSTVTENRAPTDESVKLLREMEQAAHDRVLDSIKIADNRFECVVHGVRDGYSGDILLRAIFSLNGQKMEADARLPECDRPTPQAMYDALRRAVAEKVAVTIAAPLSRLLANRSLGLGASSRGEG